MGEDLAAQWYLDNGYEVLARNWRCRAGEIDVIAARSGVLVVCEVKTRSTDYFGAPSSAVTVVKQRRLRRLAMMWIASAKRENGSMVRCSIRFDVVEVIVRGDASRLDVIENAF